jgi:hypothetical protein
MAHYVVTLGSQTHTISAWSEQDAIEEFFGSVEQDRAGVTIRPATVREALTSEYGEDWQRHLSHVVDVAKRRWMEYTNDGSPYRGYVWHEAPIITLNHTKGREIYGYEEPSDVANYRVLKDRWSELEGLTNGPWSHCSVIALDLDSEAPPDLTEVIDSLADYPVLDEDEWSRTEQEMIQEHWESYGKSDTASAVEKALGLDETGEMLSTDAEAIIEELTFSGMLGQLGNGSEYPSMLDGSACEFGEEVIAKFIADHFNTVATIEYYGRTMTVDLTRENLIA